MMTNGGDAPPNRDGSETEQSENDSPDQAAKQRLSGSAPENGISGSDQHQQDGDTPAPEPTQSAGKNSTEGLLAEPTAPRLAREQAQSSKLDRGPIAEYTTERRSLDPKVQAQWALRVTILSTIFGLITTAALGFFDVPMELGLLAIGLLVALGIVWVVLSFRIWTYQIREDSVYLERGVVTHVRTIVPYVRIQHVDTSRSALERALGLSTLVVYTAGSRGADVSIPGLKPEEARDLQQRLKELAIEADGDDAL